MSLIWNSLDLNPPPNRSILTENKGVTELKRICTNFSNILENQKTLHIEAAVLSRIIYRFKTKLRRDKGLQAMEKINRCLLQYLKLNLASVYSNFTSCIRASVDGYETNEIFAPTKQMLEYLLVRTQGFAKLMSRVVQIGELSGKYLIDRINIGHSWNLAVVSISIVARIWSLCKYLVLAACEHYNKLLPFLNVLKYVGISWTNEDINFPKDLKDWLNLEWLNNSIDDRFKKVEQSGSETNLLRVFFEDRKPDTSFFCKGETPKADLGERIARSSFQNNRVCNNSQPSNGDKSMGKLKEDETCSQPRSKESNCKKNDKPESIFKSIKSVKDLTNFVKNEEKLRMSQREVAVTKNLDNLQFHMFMKRVQRLVKELNKIDSNKHETEFNIVFKKSMKVLKLYIPY